MSSQAQFAANRANAMLSTGPKTADGIANTKHNATRHGLTGKQIVIKGEDPAAYDALRESLIRNYAPADEREAMLVEDIAQNYWRLQRARKIETQVIEKLGALECILDPEANRAFKTITRYLNSIERSWRTGTKQLEALQKARRQEAEDQANNSVIPVMAAQLPAFPPIGSVSQPAAEIPPATPGIVPKAA